MINFLNEINYNKIAEDLKGYTSRNRLEEHFQTLYTIYSPDNKKFTEYLSEAIAKVFNFNIDSEEYDWYQSRSGIDHLSSEKDIFFTLRQIIFDKEEAHFNKKILTKRKFQAKDLPQIISAVGNLNESKGSRYQFNNNRIKRLTSEILRLGYNAETLQEEIINDNKPALAEIVKAYFAIPHGVNDFTTDELAFAERINETTFKYYRKLNHDTTNKEFSTFFNEKLLRQPLKTAQKTTAFRESEITRWRSVRRFFGKTDREFIIISNYLSFLKDFYSPKNDINKATYYFGIHPDQRTRIEDFAKELKKILNFLHEETSPTAFAETITDITGPKHRIYFDCETTIVSYILHEINEKFSPLRGFNFNRIAESKMFYIPPEKKPTYVRDVQSASLKSYRLLRWENLKNSYTRYQQYKNQVKYPNRTETLYHNRITAIIKKYALKE